MWILSIDHIMHRKSNFLSITMAISQQCRIKDGCHLNIIDMLNVAFFSLLHGFKLVLYISELLTFILSIN